ncbi:MAG: hypothetical protein PHE53_05500 [Thermoguttaceae bacterium]|nr:hypothetical protein [Thermoguttaceae bacterium]
MKRMLLPNTVFHSLMIVGLVGGVWLGGMVASLPAADTVIPTGTGKRIEGNVTTANSQAVVIKDSNATEPITLKPSAVSEIVWNREPTQLGTVRTAMRKQDWSTAFTTIDRLDLQGTERKELVAEFEYLEAFITSKLVLTTGEFTMIPRGEKTEVTLAGSAALEEAGKRLLNFLKQYPDNWHAFTATMTLAEVLTAVGKYPAAQTYYQKADAVATSEAEKIRAAFQIARVQAVSGKNDEAIQQFDKVLNLPDSKNPELRSMKLQSRLGKTRLLAATDPQTALKTTDELLAEVTKSASEIPEAEQPSVLAQCWLIRGLVLESQKKPEEAMYAFLRVDTLYSGDRLAHAEALSHLVVLLENAKRPERAAEMRRTLVSRYSDTPFK